MKKDDSGNKSSGYIKGGLTPPPSLRGAPRPMEGMPPMPQEREA